MKFRNKKVVVLGAGPAGLLAAHAAMRAGYQVKMYSAPGYDGAPKKSELYGCQYLHAPIPGVGMVSAQYEGKVRYLLQGSIDGYRQKVYGDNWSGSVSVDEYGPEMDHPAWDLRKVYDTLWDRWGSTVFPLGITPQVMADMTKDLHPKTWILNTIPAPAVCRDMENHKFVSQQVYAMGSRSLEEAQHLMPYVAPDMTVQCNGDRDTGWYRAASVFGYSTLEWPGGRKPPINGVVAVSKPLSTDCTCWQSERYLRLGRYGRWEKGYLVHQAYSGAVNRLPW